MVEKDMLASSARRKRRVEVAVDEATKSSERVTARARSISQTIVGSEKTNSGQFNQINFDEEDSLVTSVEQVIATSNEQSATSSEISGERPIKDNEEKTK